MKSSNSKKVNDFKDWLNDWDLTIKTHDDIETQISVKNRFNFCIGTINKILNETDEKAMVKYQTNEDKVKAMFLNQEKQFYKDLKKVQDILTVEMYRSENLYELKNQKTKEIFRLAAENAKLRTNERSKN